MHTTMTRWKASGLHLLICALIAITVLAVMLFVWYPDTYFETMGGKRLLMILLAVDLILGPLITLVIYKPGKKGLKFDISVIAIVQLAALAYGVNVLYQSRPVFLVFAVDRFEVIAANEIDPVELKKAKLKEYQSLSVTGPRLVAVLPPTDLKERERIMFSAVQGGPDLESMPQFYAPYHDQVDSVLGRIQSLSKLLKYQPDLKTEIDLIIGEKSYQEPELGYLPVRAKGRFITAIMDRSNAEIIKILYADPWG